jgi:hypothetical protein
MTSDKGLYVTVSIPIISLCWAWRVVYVREPSRESFGQPCQLVRASIAEESACSRTQAVPLPAPPSDALRAPGAVPAHAGPCGAWGLARLPRPSRTSHGGFPLHRLRHRRPLAPTPQNLGLALQAGAWVKAAGALARVRSRLVADGRAVVCVRGLTARCSLRSLALVRQSTQQSADRSTRCTGCPRLVLGCQARSCPPWARHRARTDTAPCHTHRPQGLGKGTGYARAKLR